MYLLYHMVHYLVNPFFALKQLFFQALTSIAPAGSLLESEVKASSSPGGVPSNVDLEGVITY